MEKYFILNKQQDAVQTGLLGFNGTHLNYRANTKKKELDVHFGSNVAAIQFLLLNVYIFMSPSLHLLMIVKVNEE